MLCIQRMPYERSAGPAGRVGYADPWFNTGSSRAVAASLMGSKRPEFASPVRSRPPEGSRRAHTAGAGQPWLIARLAYCGYGLLHHIAPRACISFGAYPDDPCSSRLRTSAVVQLPPTKSVGGGQGCAAGPNPHPHLSGRTGAVQHVSQRVRGPVAALKPRCGAEVVTEFG